MHDNDSVMLQPNPTMSQRGQNCSQSVPVGVTREQFMQENQPERHFLNVDSHHSSFQPLERWYAFACPCLYLLVCEPAHV